MEVIIGIIGFIWLCSGIKWLWERIDVWREEQRSAERDQIAKDLLTEIGITNEMKVEVDSTLENVQKIFMPALIEEIELKTPSKIMRNEYGICPKCHFGVLVKRKGRYGDFLGCSNFPNCSKTQKITKSNKGAVNLEKRRIANQFMKDLERAYK